ncbi:MAG TPA: hypothetical protein P5572_06500 [Phycisphaerae bacterium]|nr:hypothetical protein [Phycisphaerales bacterium]HRX84655.1 hypothetical protein [Phycisphaerae bacterium]
MVVGFLATFILVDRLIARVQFPDTIYNTQSPARALADYEHQPGTADVVFLGCSYTAFGINPDVVDAEAQRRGVAIRSFNLGYGGALTVANTRLVELLLESDHLPKVIYYELSPAMLNRRVPSLRYAVGQIGGWREAALLWRLSPNDRAIAVLSQTLAGYHQWNTIHKIVECMREGAPIFRPKFARAASGYMTWTAGAADRDIRVSRKIEDRDHYWGNYVVDDFALEAVFRLERMAAAHGIEVRYFEMPMSTAWQQVLRDDVRSGYAEALAKLRAGGCSALWRCPSGLVDDSDYFDADHLLPSGAEKVSRAIAADVARCFGDDVVVSKLD